MRSFLIFFITIAFAAGQPWLLPLRDSQNEKTYRPAPAEKYPSWQARIDATWGDGLATAYKLQIFDTWYESVQKRYAGFNGVDADLNQLHDQYRAEIENGVSRGRFAAIMNHMSLPLLEMHQLILDEDIYNTALAPEMPLFVIGGAGNVTHAGAAVTQIADGRLVFYAVANDHPLGLQAGDVFIGYDGKPWEMLIEELEQAQLPVTSFDILSSHADGMRYKKLTAGPLNWHLFSQMQIIKKGESEITTLDLAPMHNAPLPAMFATEQIAPPGIPPPGGNLSVAFPEERLGYGIIEGTDIGYICVWDWANDASSLNTAFADAARYVMHENETSGLIVDFRYNRGGLPERAAGGFNVLFSSDFCGLGTLRRTSENDINALSEYSSCFSYYDTLDVDRYTYDKPIAVLVGPNCASAGDFNALRLSRHSNARVFGRPTAGAFIGESEFLTFDFAEEWQGRNVIENTFLAGQPQQPLMHNGLQPDENIWLTYEAIINGEDNVIQRAMDWIAQRVHIYDPVVANPNLNEEIDPVQTSASLYNPQQHTVSVSAEIKTFLGQPVSQTTLNAAGNRFEGTFPAMPNEDIYTISYTVNDHDADTSYALRDATFFTTKGPLVFAIDEVVEKSETQFHFWYSLTNMGSTAISDVETWIIAPDSNVTKRMGKRQDFPYIGPGETVRSPRLVRIVYKKNENPDYYPRLVAESSSHNYILWKSDVVSSLDETPATPHAFSLQQNYPNPFNPVTQIVYSLPRKSDVLLKLYDSSGRLVRTLLDASKPAGEHRYRLNAAHLASGVYYYRLDAAGHSQTRKMVLIK